jgi:anti-sigma regulatory factor (Ser/Thr protein kinase)
LTNPGLQETYPAIDSTVTHARRSVARFAAAAGLEDERIDAVRLAVSEAVSNAVIHAYPDRDGEVHVSAAVTPRELQVLVIDRGRGLRAPSQNPGLGLRQGRTVHRHARRQRGCRDRAERQNRLGRTAVLTGSQRARSSARPRVAGESAVPSLMP